MAHLQGQSSSSDNDDQFTLVKNGRRLNESEDEQPPSKIPTYNRFGVLDIEDSMEFDNNEEPATNPPSTSLPSTNTKSKMPVIIVTHKIARISSFHTTIKNLCQSEYSIRYLKDSINIYTSSKQDFENVKTELKSDNIEYFSYTPREERTKKIILKAAPFLKPEEIKQSLNLHQINVSEIIPLKNRKTGNFTSSFLISTPKSTNLKAFREVRAIENVHTKWEHYSKPKKISQCFNCQRFGHGSSNCNYAPRCVKCIDGHLTKDCKITRTSGHPVQCCNCKGPHTANYSECPYLVSLLKQNHNSSKENSRSSTLPPNLDQNNFPSLKKRNSVNSFIKTNVQFSNVAANNSNQNSHKEVDDFQTLVNEIKELNQICNIKQLINLVKNFKNSLSRCSNDFERISALQSLTESNLCNTN